jgi:hypothetical protein
METDIPDERLVADYEYRQQLDQMAADFREVITHPTFLAARSPSEGEISKSRFWVGCYN